MHTSLTGALIQLRLPIVYFALVLSSPILKLFGQLPTYSWRTVTAGIWVPWLLAIVFWTVLGIQRLIERLGEEK